MKVLVSDNISPKGVEILKKSGLEVDVKTGMKPEELKACISEYNGLVIRSATKVTAEIIEAATNLKVIGRAGSGLDNVDKVAASKKGIVVMNTPGGNTVTTAEHTIAMLFSVARMIPQATASMKEGKWEKKKFMGVELFNKTLGIIGLGAIGSQVAKKAQGLEMNVIAYDPFLNEDRAGAMGIRKGSLDEIFSESDFITVHSPMTPETKGLINAATISKMKNGVRISPTTMPPTWAIQATRPSPPLVALSSWIRIHAPMKRKAEAWKEKSGGLRPRIRLLGARERSKSATNQTGISSMVSGGKKPVTVAFG